MYYAGKRLLYHFFVGRAKFLQEWAKAININVHVYRCRLWWSGPVVSLHEACSKNIHIYLITVENIILGLIIFFHMF